ncbi:DUF3105 domain-containing protein [Mycolicibacterium sediminis]|uniref:DUF3105 domain-containing protein n=1 Tax=Mycolicibacterium sediminis TaxID=1286180 RepID=UPI0027E2E7D6|nr:DUF3105 domain-containing protein [Mycolicibacterium sediminis]
MADERSGDGRTRMFAGMPWGTIAAVAVLAVIGVVAWLVLGSRGEDARPPASAETDPSLSIPGIVHEDYPAGDHVDGDKRVAYDHAPPFGGAHDQVWATCTGVVYPTAIRSENAVHSLEHGAVWITYDPDALTPEQVDGLAAMIEGQPYSLMSPYPGLDSPLSVQSWGHQLKLTDPGDPRLVEFIEKLRLNENTYPEPGASCASPYFDVDDPPAFDPSPPGPDAAPVRAK